MVLWPRRPAQKLETAKAGPAPTPKPAAAQVAIPKKVSLPALPPVFSERDPLDELLAEGSATPNPDRLLTDVLEKHGGERETALAELQKALQSSKDPEFATRSGRLFAESHPSSAMAWSAQIADTKEGPDVANGVAEGLTDLRGAFSWADALPSPAARAKALGVLVGRLAATSPAEAAIWLRRFPRGDDFEKAAILVVSEWAVRNPDGARIWLDKNQQFLEGKIFAAFAGAWAKVSPAAAAKWAKEIKDPVVRQLAVAAVAQAQGN